MKKIILDFVNEVINLAKRVNSNDLTKKDIKLDRFKKLTSDTFKSMKVVNKVTKPRTQLDLVRQALKENKDTTVAEFKNYLQKAS